MVPRLTAENRLTSAEKIFCDPFFFFSQPPTPPGSILLKTFGPACQEWACPRLRGLRLRCAVCRISAAKRQRAPDTPARRGRARPESSRVPDPRTERSSTVSGPGLQGQMGQSRLHLPESSGRLRRPQPGWPSARPTAPGGGFAAPVAFGD